MGRGGDAGAFVAPAKIFVAEHIVSKSPLSDRPVEELRKLAEQRGLKNDGTREDLLVKLKPFAKVCHVRSVIRGESDKSSVQNRFVIVPNVQSQQTACCVSWEYVAPLRTASSVRSLLSWHGLRYANSVSFE